MRRPSRDRGPASGPARVFCSRVLLQRIRLRIPCCCRSRNGVGNSLLIRLSCARAPGDQSFRITPASARGHAAARDAQAAAEFAGRLSGPAPKGADEMAGVGVAELHGDLSDLHLALLQ
jgi:hypothetical protein